MLAQPQPGQTRTDGDRQRRRIRDGAVEERDGSRGENGHRRVGDHCRDLRRRVPRLLDAVALRRHLRVPDAVPCPARAPACTVGRLHRPGVCANSSRPGWCGIDHRHDGRQFQSRRYHVRTSSPVHATAAEGGGRRCAALPRGSYPDTTSTPTPTAATAPDAVARTPEAVAGRELLDACGIDDIHELSRRCVAVREAVGRTSARWSPQCLVMAIRLALNNRGWRPDAVVPALLAVAADPDTLPRPPRRSRPVVGRRRHGSITARGPRRTRWPGRPASRARRPPATGAGTGCRRAGRRRVPGHPRP